jgi:predicted enzyme related to lactoylglutathione lyase
VTERVLGIGGVFLRARDPAALLAWYGEHLGVELQDWGGTVFRAEQGDETVWHAFPAESEYFPRAQQAMVNFRVRDLDAMLTQLRAAGAEVDAAIEDNAYGKFGWAVDPEGNRFELWQPPAVQ